MLVQPAQLGVLGEVLDVVWVPGVVLVAQDPSDVAPPEALQRRVQIELGVAVAVVVAMVAGPPQRALLRRRRAADGHHELHAPAELVAAVGEVAVVAGGDEEHPTPEQGQEQHQGGRGHTGDKGEKTHRVDQEEWQRRLPVQALFRRTGDGMLLQRRLACLEGASLPTGR